MNRSTYYVSQTLLKKIKRGDEVIKTTERDSTIGLDMINRIFLVHNGKKFIRVKVTENMLGRKLGEFALTRRLGIHGKAGTH